MYVQEKILGEECMGEKSVQEEPAARLGEVFFFEQSEFRGSGGRAPRNGQK